MTRASQYKDTLSWEVWSKISHNVCLVTVAGMKLSHTGQEEVSGVQKKQKKNTNLYYKTQSEGNVYQ